MSWTDCPTLSDAGKPWIVTDASVESLVCAAISKSGITATGDTEKLAAGPGFRISDPRKP